MPALCILRVLCVKGYSPCGRDSTPRSPAKIRKCGSYTSSIQGSGRKHERPKSGLRRSRHPVLWKPPHWGWALQSHGGFGRPLEFEDFLGPVGLFLLALGAA